MSRLVGYLRSLPKPPAPGRVVVTPEGVDAFEGADRAWHVAWPAVRRVGYVREESGLPDPEDHFLGLQTSDILFLVSLAVPGARELALRIPFRFPCVFGDKGDLGDVTGDDSVVVWPAEEAGRALFEGTAPAKTRFLTGIDFTFRGKRAGG